MANYLVTGGAGFIGSHVVKRLAAAGETVRVLDNFSTGRLENIVSVVDDIELIEGDLRSYHAVLAAVAGVDYVLHLAALPSVPRSVKDPITSADVNIMGTLNVLHAANSMGVKRVVIASSSSVYGSNPALPKREDMCPHPLSPYAVSKLSTEQFCQTFGHVYGMETVALRYFNVFGPGQNPQSQYAAVIPKFIDSLLHDEQLTVHGDGTQSRDFTYVDNVVQANLLACTAADASGGVYNIACGERHSLNELIGELEALVGKSARIEYAPTRAGDVAHSLADIALARSQLGYEPSVSFSEGLRRTIDWTMEKR